MRTVLICSTLCLAGSLCFAQADSSKVIQQPADRQVAIPGVDTPVSGPGLTAQVPLNTPPPPQNGRKKRRTQPPSDPRAFGVGIPIEKDKSRKDTLRN
ncbi:MULTISPECIES: hypothetical protein [unclassified Spirosoma]|uniref:hypothetical protein n=1 Tax=unclassified Spirosoma TaxID=2621999 RepID=UPI000959E697|nr:MULTISPECIES: hypothetical protein [unclassified Spirosoma]MBN8822247.1 hypothetical protein [Spirosoma sp.]OJW72440.1 MAG: hypothetical protein BGO59_15015 [Spirosoma sp. 48-14]